MLAQAFAVFDRNKDGYVDAQELRFALCNYGEAMTQQEADEVKQIQGIKLLFILIFLGITLFWPH